MRAIRLQLVAALVAAPVLLAAELATAQKTYPLSGKIISTRGTFIRIPVLGNTVNNCTTLQKGRRTGYLTSGTRTVFQLDQLTVGPVVPHTSTVTPNQVPGGCVNISGNIVASAEIRGTGDTFTVPTNAFNKPFKNTTVAVPVPLEPQILQLATQFRIFGPPTARPTAGEDAPGYMLSVGMMSLGMGFTPSTTIGPTMLATSGGNPTNLAPLRRLQQSAWVGQTGRGATSFTWCFPPTTALMTEQGHNCVLLASGMNMIVKVQNPNTNKFGGTMNYLIQTGSLPSSLGVGTAPAGPVELLGLAGSGHQPTGRGYADLLTDRIMTGDAWLMHMEGVVTPSQFGGAVQFTLITGVTGIDLVGMGNVVAATNKNWGFPWTTGTVQVKQTGSTLGQPMSATFTAMGTDTTSITAGSGMARNLTLVAPQLARTNIAAGTNTVGIGFMTLTLPEPGGSAQLLAGALGLAAMAAWRSRRRRS